MGLTLASANKHIAKWQSELHKDYFPWRRHWPTRLFHHAPLENAIAILRDGHLRSRNDQLNERPRDVAASGVIGTRDDAHDRVRLYFRPKTPTQWHIEGIRKPGECKYGENAHAPVLYMFALEAVDVLTLDDVWFSDKNMQLGSAQRGDDLEFFRAIPFEKVYSEGGTGGDRSYIDARCAEVMPASPLQLQDRLKEIFCRSDAERDTLLHLAGDEAERWAEICLVSDSLKVFEKNFAFVTHASLSSDGFRFQMNPRSDYKQIEVAIRVRRCDDLAQVLSYKGELRHKPVHATNWIIEGDMHPGAYHAEMKIEGHLAYSAVSTIGDVIL